MRLASRITCWHKEFAWAQTYGSCLANKSHPNAQGAGRLARLGLLLRGLHSISVIRPPHPAQGHENDYCALVRGPRHWQDSRQTGSFILPLIEFQTDDYERVNSNSCFVAGC
jgi:hypothetical protein